MDFQIAEETQIANRKVHTRQFCTDICMDVCTKRNRVGF